MSHQYIVHSIHYRDTLSINISYILLCVYLYNIKYMITLQKPNDVTILLNINTK